MLWKNKNNARLAIWIKDWRAQSSVQMSEMDNSHRRDSLGQKIWCWLVNFVWDVLAKLWFCINPYRGLNTEGGFFGKKVRSHDRGNLSFTAKHPPPQCSPWQEEFIGWGPGTLRALYCGLLFPFFKFYQIKFYTSTDAQKDILSPWLGKEAWIKLGDRRRRRRRKSSNCHSGPSPHFIRLFIAFRIYFPAKQLQWIITKASWNRVN